MNIVQTRVIFDRKKQATSKRTALVQIEIRHQGKRKFVSTGIHVAKNQFKAGRVVNRTDAESLNKRISLQIEEIYTFVDRCNSANTGFRLSAINAMNDRQASFVDFFAKRIEERPIENSTKRQHRKVLNFLLTEYKGRLDDFSQLTLPAIIRLDDYLHARKLEDGRKMMQTTIHTYHKVIKCYINEAVKLGYTSANPYANFKNDTGQPKRRVILTTDEINLIRNYRTTSTLEAKVRDLFIVQCYTGLAYADLMDTDFTKSEGNLLQGERRKTGVRFSIYLLPPVLEILQKYNNTLPHLSYDVYNRWLKAVATAAGVKKTVTTHIGRHTFATTIALGSGLPIEVISHMLGHTDIKTTQIYTKILPQNVIEGGMKMLKHIQ